MNDIPLNLFGDNQHYKVIPDIGEMTKNDILCAIRREQREEAFYSQDFNRLSQIFMSDEKITVFGKVVDLDIQCNNPEMLNEIYYAQIAHIDTQIGRLIRTLKYQGEMPDMIIFTSDHGEMLGDHHLFRKTYAYEGSAAVPCIIWTKDKQYGTKEETPIVLEDLYTTILGYAGLKALENVDGLNLMPLLNQNKVTKKEWDREWIHGEHARCYSPDEAMQFMTDGKTKYIWFTHTGEEQLFDLSNDPYECNELSKDEKYEDILLTWRQRMIEYLATRKEDNLSDGTQLLTGLLPAYRKGLYK